METPVYHSNIYMKNEYPKLKSLGFIGKKLCCSFGSTILSFDHAANIANIANISSGLYGPKNSNWLGTGLISAKWCIKTENKDFKTFIQNFRNCLEILWNFGIYFFTKFKVLFVSIFILWNINRIHVGTINQLSNTFCLFGTIGYRVF